MYNFILYVIFTALSKYIVLQMKCIYIYILYNGYNNVTRESQVDPFFRNRRRIYVYACKSPGTTDDFASCQNHDGIYSDCINNTAKY